MFEFAKSMKRCATAAAIVAMTTLGGCIMPTPYVDTTLKDLKPEDKVQVANPQPVQLVFEFQTKGTPNNQVTDMLKPVVLKTVQDSGAFSQVGDTPQSNGAILHISLNNVPLTDDAFAKGFATGLTLGLVGATVGDGYVCRVDYLPGGSAPTITKTERDAIYTSIGATAGTPAHAQKMKDYTEAANFMTRKIVANAVNDLAKDPAFGK
jgi:hypothetical protein